MSPVYDVILIGLGGMGSAAACHLARRGMRVLGLERFKPVHAHGSSHGGSRIIRSLYYEDPAYVPLLQHSYELWQQTERDADADLLTITGGLTMGTEESHIIAGSVHTATRYGLDHQILDAAETHRRYPTLTPCKDILAVYDPRAGVVRPESSVAAHLKLAERHGANLHYSEPILSWHAEPTGDGARVHTTKDTYSASRLVICPGPWAPQILADLDIEFQVERYVQYWFEPTTGIVPFDLERHPIYIWDCENGVVFCGCPGMNPVSGAKVAFCDGQPCTADTIDRTVHPQEVQQIRDVLRPRIPSLADGELICATTCMDANTLDQNFVIAPHPEHPQVIVGCGFSGHGFKFVPVVGEILADLAVDGVTRYPVALFDSNRSMSSTPVPG